MIKVRNYNYFFLSTMHIQHSYCNNKIYLIIQYAECKATKFFIIQIITHYAVVNVPDYCEIQEFDEQTHEDTL